MGMLTSMTENLTSTGLIIQSYLDRYGWMRRDLAERAQISPTTVTNVMESTKRPKVGTLEKIAAALDINPAILVSAAEPSVARASGITDPQALDVAQRIEELPLGVREYAIRAVTIVIDNIRNVADATRNAALDEIDEIVLVEDFKERITLLSQLLEEHHPDTAHELRRRLEEHERLQEQEGATVSSSAALGKVPK